MRRSWRGRRVPWTAVGWVVLLAVGAALVITVASGVVGYRGQPSSAAPGSVVIPPVPVSAAELARLPRSTTYTDIPAAPRDPTPFAVTDGLVVRPEVQQVIYAAPGKRPVAVLPVTEVGEPTWVPVVQTSPGWDRVLLPSRPDRSTGWIFTGATTSPQLDVRHTSDLIRVAVGARTLTIDEGGRSLGTWKVAVGAPATPTPTGRTYLLALLAPPQPSYSPLILPLGTHSNTFTTFGGGPGTVGIHGWADPSVFGQAVSNGCIRVPADALHLLSTIPLGTLVLVTE